MTYNFEESLKKICPVDGTEMDAHHRDGDMLAPEADWYVCPECGYETEPE